MLPKDYVRLRLTGESAIDVADASGTLLLDVTHRIWSSEVLNKTGIDVKLLAKLYESQEICGKLSAAGAEATGSARRNAGRRRRRRSSRRRRRHGHHARRSRQRHDWNFRRGFRRDRSSLRSIPKAVSTLSATPFPGRWHVMGVTQSAGLSLRWFRDRFGAGPDDGRDPYERMSAEAATVPTGSEGAFWAPYLMGERTPHLDPFARAAFVGLSASHTRAHLIRAVLEGVAYSLKDTFSIFDEINVPVERIRLGGGGARSPLWQQIQADVYAREVEILKAEEGAAYGAAILAGVGSGVWKSVDEACDTAVSVAQRVRVSKEDQCGYAGGYKTYRRIYPALHSIFAENRNLRPHNKRQNFVQASQIPRRQTLRPFFCPGLKK